MVIVIILVLVNNATLATVLDTNATFLCVMYFLPTVMWIMMDVYCSVMIKMHRDRSQKQKERMVSSDFDNEQLFTRVNANHVQEVSESIINSSVDMSEDT